MRRRAAAACLLLAVACGPQPDDPVPLVFAAASLRTALDEIAPACGTGGAPGFRASYAGSSALARQILADAPADLFISADRDWMDEVERAGRTRPETRVDLLGNTLVLVAPAGQTPEGGLAIAPGFPLAAALGDGRLAVADPDAVPAGKYARAALVTLGVWDDVTDRLAPAENVRAALLLVSRGEAPLGIVYRTDALADAGVEVVGSFDASTHPPIIYPAAVTAAASDGALAVLACLRAPAARAVFERWGFTVLEGAGPP